jgi:hypothetical protein
MRGGDVCWNPLTGEKALILESAEETGGARIVAELAVEEGGFAPGGEHVHDAITEQFDVEQGRMPSSSTARSGRSRRETMSPCHPGPGTSGGMQARAR